MQVVDEPLLLLDVVTNVRYIRMCFFFSFLVVRCVGRSCPVPSIWPWFDVVLGQAIVFSRGSSH